MSLMKLDEALKDINAVLGLTQYNALAYALKSRIYYRMDDIAKAKEELSIAVSIDPNQDEVKKTIELLNFSN